RGCCVFCLFFFSSRRRHTRSKRDWSSDVCSSDLVAASRGNPAEERLQRTRAQAFRREVALLDDEVGSTTVRAPVSGMVLTPRPRSEERRVGKEWRARWWADQ